MKHVFLLLLLVAAAAASANSPYNWSSSPCTLLQQSVTHPPDSTLVVGILFSNLLEPNFEARVPIPLPLHGCR
eukprot:m51a1_g13149 hypothetical protein (73) ;mRNA; f:7651-7940